MSTNRPSVVQLEIAGKLLALQREEGDALTAALAVHERLFQRFSPILGIAGVRALFARSARLAGDENVSLRDFAIRRDEQQGTQLRELLQGRTELAISEDVADLYAWFFCLLGAFIGDELTMKVVHGAWPQLGEAWSATRRERVK